MVQSRRAVRKSLRTNFDPDLRWRAARLKMRAQQLAHLPVLLSRSDLDRPIFIIGAPRSGTSMLYSILAGSSEITHWRPGEAHEVWEANYHPALTGWSSNVLSADHATPEESRRIRREFLLVTGTRKRLLDKTPRNVLRIPFIDAIFGDARYVFLKRDGRDTVNSLINAWRSPGYRTYELPERHSIPGVDPRWWKFVLYPGWQQDRSGPLEVICAKQWSLSNEHALQARAQGEPARWIELSYEDLVAEPVDQVTRVTEFLELPLERALVERAAAAKTRPINVITPPERGKWRRENPNEIHAVLPLIEPTMRKLGYEATERA